MSKFKIGDVVVPKVNKSAREYVVTALSPRSAALVFEESTQHEALIHPSNEHLYIVKPKPPLKRRAFVDCCGDGDLGFMHANENMAHIEVEYTIDPVSHRIIGVELIRVIPEEKK